MKSRLNLIAAALLVLIGSMVWVLEDRAALIPAPAMAAAPASAADRAEPVAPPIVSAPVAAPAPAPTPAPAPAAPVALVPPPREPAPSVSIDASGRATYAAQDGDTLSQLAAALFGTSTRANRDAVVAANSSLQSNPDFVLPGQEYSTTPAATPAPTADDVDDQKRDAALPATAAESSAGATRVVDKQPAEAPVAASPTMRYIAQAGDTVRGLAADLLGGDTQLNRDAIIDGNASLQENPNHLVAGKSYSIVARNGLSADPNAPPAQTPTTQPTADEVARLSVGRELRYTAVSGDTVSKLALTLLGADTAANRDLIIQSNASLKAAPDHVIVGKTYWIPAPTAAHTR